MENIDLDSFIFSVAPADSYPHRVVRTGESGVNVLAYSDPMKVVEMMKDRLHADQLKFLALTTKTEITKARKGRFIRIIENKMGYQVVKSVSVVVAEDMSNIDNIFYTQ